jgi:hypothetical protein
VKEVSGEMLKFVRKSGAPSTEVFESGPLFFFSFAQNEDECARRLWQELGASEERKHDN